MDDYDIIELAWAAGLLEGEGCFLIKQGISCGSVDKDVIDKLQRILRCGKIYVRDLESGKTFYNLVIKKKQDVVNVCHLILPFMGKRRAAKIEELISANHSDQSLAA